MEFKYRKSMDPLVHWAVPQVPSGAPSFLGVPVMRDGVDLAEAEVAIIGVPFEVSPPVARDPSATVLTPLSLRKDSLKYAGYLPELDIEIFDYLKILDCGDVEIPPYGNTVRAIEETVQVIRKLAANDRLVIILGGGEICGSYGGIRALAELDAGQVGVISLDAHGDNMEVHLGDPWSGASWIARMAELPGVRMDSHVHIGMRGPRNYRDQIRWFREKGTQLYTVRELRQRGMAQIAREAIAAAHTSTSKVFMSVDFDVLDIGCAHGLDEPLGLRVEELLALVYHAGLSGLNGFAVGWIPQLIPPLNWITTWTIVYLLAGFAARKLPESQRPDVDWLTY